MGIIESWTGDQGGRFPYPGELPAESVPQWYWGLPAHWGDWPCQQQIKEVVQWPLEPMSTSHHSHHQWIPYQRPAGPRGFHHGPMPLIPRFSLQKFKENPKVRWKSLKTLSEISFLIEAELDRLWVETELSGRDVLLVSGENTNVFAKRLWY